jgi:hypothetical protein
MISTKIGELEGRAVPGSPGGARPQQPFTPSQQQQANASPPSSGIGSSRPGAAGATANSSGNGESSAEVQRLANQLQNVNSQLELTIAEMAAARAAVGAKERAVADLEDRLSKAAARDTERKQELQVWGVLRWWGCSSGVEPRTEARCLAGVQWGPCDSSEERPRFPLRELNPVHPHLECAPDLQYGISPSLVY